jgi:hypothetical protein
MKCDYWVSFFARTFASHYFDREPRARVATYVLSTLDVESLHHEIPSKYKEFKNVDTLPKHRPYDCTIDLEEGTQSPFEPIYNLSQDELIVLRKYIDENLEKELM